MKINIPRGELFQVIIGIALLFLLISLFGNFFESNVLFSVIIFLLFFANYIIILIHERKYEENFPYKPYKSNRKIGKRILKEAIS